MKGREPRKRRFSVTGAWLLAWLALGCGRPAAQVALPAEALKPQDEGASRQIGEREEELREIEASGASQAEVAQAVGELGRLYHGFQLLDGYALPQLEAAAICYAEARRLDGHDWRWPYLLGFTHQTLGKLEEAARDYRAALELNPGHAPGHHRLAEVELDLGRFDEAAALWQHALSAQPDFAAALYSLGHLAWSRGDAATAVEYLERALQIEPGASRGHHTLGLAYRDLGETARATEQLRQGGAVGFSLNDRLIEDMASLPSGSRALVRQGLAAVLAGELAAAIASLKRAVAADLASPYARRNLAVALADAGRLEEAAEAFRELIDLDPEDASAHLSLGRLEATRGDLSQAILHFRQAVELAPDFKQAHYSLAVALERAGRRNEALLQYEAVMELDPDFAEVRTKRAAALVAAGRRDEGFRSLRRQVATAPDDASAWRSLSVALRDENRLEEAQKVLEQALEGGRFEPLEEATLRLELGRTLAMRERPLEALPQLEAARRLAPTLIEGSYLLGLVQARLERFEEAGLSFETILRSRPTFGPARVGLAQSLQVQGRCPDAMEVLEEGLRLSPSDSNLAQALRQLRSVC